MIKNIKSISLLITLSVSLSSLAGNGFYKQGASLQENAKAIAQKCAGKNLSLESKESCYQTAVKAYDVYQKQVMNSDSDVFSSFLQQEYSDKVVVSIHSYTMNALDAQDAPRHFFDNGNSGLFVALTGHREDGVLLKDIKGKEWINDTKLVVMIAQGLADKVIVSGFSLGGILAIQAAKANPSLVDGYVAMAPSFHGGVELPMSEMSCLARVGAVRNVVKGVSGYDLNDEFILGGCAIFKVSKKITRNAQASVFRKNKRRDPKFKEQYTQAKSSMRKLKMPGVIVHSEKDAVVSHEVTTILSEVLSDVAGSNFKSFKYFDGQGKGHWGDDVYFDDKLEFSAYDAFEFLDSKLK